MGNVDVITKKRNNVQVKDPNYSFKYPPHHQPDKAPGSPPRNVRARPHSLQTIRIDWDEPEIPNGIIQGYKVFYTTNPELPIILWKNQEVAGDNNKMTTISGLIPNSTYTICVLAYSSMGQGPLSVPVQVMTRQGAPGSPPRNVRARPHSLQTIRIDWDEPEIPNGIIQGYKVFYTTNPELPIILWKNQEVAGDNNKMTTISGLIPNSTYTICVLAYSSMGQGPLSVPVQVMTRQGAPGSPPRNVRARPHSLQTIRIDWDEPEIPNGIIQGYKVFYTTNPELPIILWKNQEVAGDNNKMTTISGLIPNSTYTICVLAYSSMGQGPLSVPVQVMTRQGDVCSQPADSGFCLAWFPKWFYDSTANECRKFVYGGCHGNGNRFNTEDECYSVCKEKLVQLHPPQNVTVAYAQSNRMYVYWYPPINYKQHEPNITNGTSNSDSKTDLSDRNTRDDVTTSKPDNTSVASSKNNDSSTKNETKTGEENVTANPATTGTTKEVIVIAGTNLSATDYIGKDRVPFHFARLIHYVITVKLSSGQFVKNISVPHNVTEKNITSLKPSTEYNIIVSALYKTTTMSAEVVTKKTADDPSKATKCFCDPFGTKEGGQKCNLSISQAPWCECKPRYAGLFCEICAHGFYRTARSMPCHSCPCPKTFSTGSCHFVDGYLHCITCKEGYAGNLCHRCDNGYYRDHQTAPSKCVECNVCHNVKPALICDPFTGKCLNCHYNTTGDKCDRCLDGFEGDPLKKIPCTPIHVCSQPADSGFCRAWFPKWFYDSTANECRKFVYGGCNGNGNRFNTEDECYSVCKAKMKKGSDSPAVGIIAAIVVGTIVLLSGIVGFVVYKRSHNFPKNKPFWTIEFKEDHEDVNFSAVPEDELERQHSDMNYYETQSKGKNKLPPYSQLKEDI